MAAETYTLVQLHDYIRQVFALNFEAALWLEADIAQSSSSRGHYYLDLTEMDTQGEQIVAQARATLWSGASRILLKKHGDSLYDILQEGQRVRLLVTAQFHERYGYSLNIQDIDPSYTIGQLALDREKTLAQLQNEKLLDLQKELRIPVAIQKIAVLSSPTAAGYADFIDGVHLNAAGYDIQVDLFTVALQGALTESEVVSTLASPGIVDGNYELICLIRGGGSRVDLAAFDSLGIARAIARCPIPVLTGIGHEIDLAVADRVSYQAVKTPTAAAEFIIQHNMAFEQSIDELGYHFREIVLERVRDAQLMLDQGMSTLGYAMRSLQEDISRSDDRLRAAARSTLDQHDKQLNLYQRMLTALHPDRVLERGYALISDRNNNIISSKSQVHTDALRIRWQDGQMDIYPES